MNDQQKARRHSCIFTGYIEKAPKRDIYGRCLTSTKGYEFYIHLTSMKSDTGGEEKFLPVPKYFKIRAYCHLSYREKEDQYAKVDETLELSLIPSIHVGSLIEFRGTAYKKGQNGKRNVVIPQQIKSAYEIEMDRHYIQIMPPNDESVKKYQTHVKEENEKQRGWKQRDRKWQWKSWKSNRIEEVKKHWIVITLTLLTIICAFIIALFIKS